MKKHMGMTGKKTAMPASYQLVQNLEKIFMSAGNVEREKKE